MKITFLPITLLFWLLINDRLNKTIHWKTVKNKSKFSQLFLFFFHFLVLKFIKKKRIISGARVRRIHGERRGQVQVGETLRTNNLQNWGVEGILQGLDRSSPEVLSHSRPHILHVRTVFRFFPRVWVSRRPVWKMRLTL